MRPTALAFVCFVISLNAGRSQAPGVMLPPVALQAADVGVAPLAYLLARARVMAGIVTTKNPSDFMFLRGAAGLDAAPSVPLGEVLARFTKAHPEYRPVWRDRILSLAPDGSACASGVRTTMVGPMEFEGDASRVVVFLTWMVRGQTGQPRGMTGSVLGKLDDLGQTLASIKYVLTAPVSMESALDKVVQMHGGGVWFAWQHTRSDGRTGCRAVVYWPNGLVSAPEEDFFFVRAGGAAAADLVAASRPRRPPAR